MDQRTNPKMDDYHGANQNSNRGGGSCNYCPDPLFRPPPRLRKATTDPHCYVSFSAIRGFRPGDYFTRGTTLGGGTRAGGLASVGADVRPEDGYAWRAPTCVGDVPRISACSRYCPPIGYLAEKERMKLPGCRRKLYGVTSSSSSDSASSEEARCPTPPPCVCATQVEAKKVTHDAFTMTERYMRDQGVAVGALTSNKNVATEYVTRDVATDTDDPLDVEPQSSIDSSERRSHRM